MPSCWEVYGSLETDLRTIWARTRDCDCMSLLPPNIDCLSGPEAFFMNLVFVAESDDGYDRSSWDSSAVYFPFLKKYDGRTNICEVPSLVFQ